ncbi:CesT family type III secretion system chaperone [Pigmentiphaga sp.]|uniref:CesT family type III secretion system chaperone n=1 Tax=Pigmentiphaga sp. TaxID=1977564 RepID=UPI0025F7A818|nr:CesT family type III secretion system chaperone [Pigmentiphaga sp.]
MNAFNRPEGQTFTTLLQELAVLSGVTTPLGPRDNAQLEVEGIGFTVIEGVEPDQGTLVYFCDFGAVPETTQRADILQRLLEANLLMCGTGAPTFAVNFETSRVVLMGRAHLAEIDAQRLLNAFAQYANQARSWQQTYFLEGQNKPSGNQQHRLRVPLAN